MVISVNMFKHYVDDLFCYWKQNVWPVEFLGVNSQRQNKSSDDILCLVSKNVHKGIQNNRDL